MLAAFRKLLRLILLTAAEQKDQELNQVHSASTYELYKTFRLDLRVLSLPERTASNTAVSNVNVWPSSSVKIS